MTHASLFTGIGGFDIAAEWMGWDNIFQVEIDKWCQRLLSQNFPNAKRYTDIKEFNGMPYHGEIDVISGGFPCQPYSTAGKRKGKDDDRHIWPEMLRIIREIQPTWVVGENVRGLVSWNGGLVFDEVQANLESEGYEVIPFILPSASIGAPHRRDRVWFIAHSASHGYCPKNRPVRNVGQEAKDKGQANKRKWVRLHDWGTYEERRNTGNGNICGMDDGLPLELDENRLKGLGNAVVPQVVLQIFKSIEEYELLTKT